MFGWTYCNNKRSMEYRTAYGRWKRKMQALSLAKECYSIKMDLLTNATVVDDAIRFVSQKSKEKIKSSNEVDKEESKEPDYDEDKDQLEEESRKRKLAK
jgi:hypothetical protein